MSLEAIQTETVHEAQPGGPSRAFLAREECFQSSPSHPVWEKQYDSAGISFVISGTFDYHSQVGKITAVPGTVVFNNCDEYCSIHHLNNFGIRRLAVWYDKGFLEKLAEAHELSEKQFRFVALQPGKVATNMFIQLLALVKGWGDVEDIAYTLAVAALTAQGERGFARGVSGRDRGRIISAVRHIENSYCEECSVDRLAGISGLSRDYFMRLFKAVTGQSANQYVINTRLRAAALRIVETDEPFSDIALGVGFNDISHFNTCFRMIFDCAPRQMRRRRLALALSRT